MSPVGEKNGVQELRKIISMYLAHVYHNDEKRMGKRKMKNLWDKAPEDWPKQIPFVDPNNGLKEGGGKQQKPKKHELVPMYNFLRQKYEESIQSQGTVGTTVLRPPFPQESSCNSTVPEQGQKPIPTHNIPATVATNFMTHGAQINVQFPQKMITENPGMQESMKTEVSDQVNKRINNASLHCFRFFTLIIYCVNYPDILLVSAADGRATLANSSIVYFILFHFKIIANAIIKKTSGSSRGP